MLVYTHTQQLLIYLEHGTLYLENQMLHGMVGIGEEALGVQVRQYHQVW